MLWTLWLLSENHLKTFFWSHHNKVLCWKVCDEQKFVKTGAGNATTLVYHHNTHWWEYMNIRYEYICITHIQYTLYYTEHGHQHFHTKVTTLWAPIYFSKASIGNRNDLHYHTEPTSASQSNIINFLRKFLKKLIWSI